MIEVGHVNATETVWMETRMDRTKIVWGLARAVFALLVTVLTPIQQAAAA
jgi:hypothetical protein